MSCATWYEGTAQLLSLTEFKSHLFELCLLAEPLTDDVFTHFDFPVRVRVHDEKTKSGSYLMFEACVHVYRVSLGFP